jgi:ubiquinone/menaquinone biosynthesis C-methylase UbiE
MLRPDNKFIEKAYFAYLTTCVAIVAWMFRSNKYALGCKKYFVDALKMFYSPKEMTQLLYEKGFTAVSSNPLLFGVVGSHKAVKALQ